MRNTAAQTPPMGWNSWDCYGASVTEAEVKGNAEYIAKHMKKFGWKYVVVDIQWYEPTALSSAYNKFTPLEMDEYSRLIPAVNRFPSSAGGKGFGPLAEYVHGLGLKFGIHIMRGIPRQAAHANTPILGTKVHAREIAHVNSICQWNTDMYGVDAAIEGAQAYYDSIVRLYASWGVDYIKVDDISRPYSLSEVELIRNAIDYCGREIVLSLSPGPAPIEHAEHLKANANMWRMTDDFWDQWRLLDNMFERCSQWAPHTGPGHWPDADMLPLGHIALRSCEHGKGDRWTNFTRDEQITMLTLWCIFRSPLMVGCELRDNDDWTLSLLTNEEVLRLLEHSHSARQLYQRGAYNTNVAWTSIDEDGSLYLAVFNRGTFETVTETQLSLMGAEGSYRVRDLWAHEELGEAERLISVTVAPHGARLLKLTK
ncbi:MAG TPA: glycoside hydrolase family 27 protein [Clostridia bacterium]|nr:glycoside hydrolase family 27 protein [Clostridia bacterium]